MMEKIIQGVFLEHQELGKLLKVEPMSGGCINHTFYAKSTQGEFVVKMNQGKLADFFEKEQDGLIALKTLGHVMTPEVLQVGVSPPFHYLVLQYIPSSTPSEKFWENCAIGLSKMHLVTHPFFGWHTDNYIGALPQINAFTLKWIDFFIQHRLEAQLHQVQDLSLQSSLRRRFEKLYRIMEDMLEEEQPALLHGDFWQGNLISDRGNQAFFLDPAVYYGHREMDLAFSTLFGGFPLSFYSVYQENYPLKEGYRQRCEIYNLYPLLVHFNLFGGNYLHGIDRVLNIYAN